MLYSDFLIERSSLHGHTHPSPLPLVLETESVGIVQLGREYTEYYLYISLRDMV